MSLVAQWATRLGVAAGLAASLEYTGTRLHVTAATSDVSGAIHLFFALWAVFSVIALPFVLALAAFDRWVARSWWPEPAKLVAISLGAVVTTLAVLLVDHAFNVFPANEFPERTNLLRTLLFLLVVGLGVGMSFAFLPVFRRVWSQLPHLNRPRVVSTFLVLVAAGTGFYAVHFGLAPIHLSWQVRVAGIASIALLVVGTRWTLFPIRPRPARWAGGLWLAACLFAFCVSCRSYHANFMLFAHCPIASNLAGGLRDIVDFDGDGAASWWLGGADCAEFDSGIGPARLEIPGDGIDQDCRGGDARPPTQPEPPRLFADCKPPPTRPNVLLITVDALRADAVKPRIMPNLSRFSALTIDFKRAYVPATQTKLSIASMFSGHPVSDLGASNMITHRDLHMGRPLPVRFQDAGYTTTFYNLLYVHPAITGGFEEINPGREQFDVYPGPAKLAFASAGLTTILISALKQLQDRPFFKWIHYPDLHAPYLRSREWAPSGLDLYEAEAAYVDFHLGRLLASIKTLGLDNTTLVAITADHGEDLGERGREGHGPNVYESTIHVPLLLWIPGCRARIVAEPVSLSRLGSTLATLSGVPMPGRTLMPHIGEDVPVVAEVVQVLDLFKRAVIGERYKLILDVRNGGRVLFDLELDPGETKNIYSVQPEIADLMEERYQRWLDSPGAR